MGNYDLMNKDYYQSSTARFTFNYVLPNDYSDNFEYLNGAEVSFIFDSISFMDYSIDDKFVSSYSEDYTGHHFDTLEELREWWDNRKEESIFK